MTNQPRHYQYASKYAAKEYDGSRPCIDPLAMAELRIRTAPGSGQPRKLDTGFFGCLRLLWNNIQP